MRKKNSRTDFIIDLTSLLDVIFIVLLIVMCRQAFLSTNEHAQLKHMQNEAEERKNEANARKTYYEQHTEKYENIEKYVRFVDVVASFNSVASIYNRTVVMTSDIEEGSEPMVLPVTQAKEEEDYAQIRDYLTGIIEEASKDGSIPVILSLNRGDENILYRDEVAIYNIFEYLASQYDNVFTR